MSQRSTILKSTQRRGIGNLINITTEQPRYHYQLPTTLLCNPRSLNNKVDELSLILNNNKVDIGAITETWFSPDQPVDQISIHGYNIFSRPRKEQRGGGVALYTKECLNATLLDNIEVPDDIEAIWVNVRPPRLPRSISNIVIGTVYYPPKSIIAQPLLDHISSTVDQILTRQPDSGIIVMGDFNRLELDPLLSNNFTQIVDKPTREDAILDKIITNLASFYNPVEISSPLGLSDHRCVIVRPKSPIRNTNTSKTRVVRPMKDSDVRECGSWLSDHDWLEVISTHDVTAKCTEFYETLNCVLDTYFPKKSVKKHPSDKSWLTPYIKSLVVKRQRAFHGNQQSLWRYFRNKINREIKLAKKTHYTTEVERLKKSNPSSWFREVRLITTGASTNRNIQLQNIDPTAHKDIASAICEKFAAVGNDLDPLDTSLLPAYLLAKPIPPVQPWEVLKQLQRISSTKASGPDNISARFIRQYSYELSKPLTHIINASFAQLIVPAQWKRAIVVPVPKTSPANIDNLRPIALTDHFAKVTEHFIAQQTMASIKPNLDPAQFGNIKNVSTTHCLIDVLHTLHANAELPKSISSILLTDFSKTFDHINHTIAVSKLLKLGVPPHLAAWIGDFISNHEQCVRYLDCLSEWTPTNAGVPQGTKLGAIIFLAVINDAGFKENNTSIKHFKYVDDMTVIETRDASVGSNLPSAITDLDVWSSDNKMQLNVKKCFTMDICFLRNQPVPLSLTLNDKTITQCAVIKLLGVFIQADLRWDTHVGSMIKRANSRLFMLRKLKYHYLSISDLVAIYTSFVRPILEYAAPAWSGALSSKQCNDLERVQKRACRIILGNDYVRYSDALQLCSIETLVCRRNHLCQSFAKTLPSSVLKRLLPKRYDSGYQLRNSGLLGQFKCRTERYRKSPLPHLTRLFNN
ncbi:uncharacterized protein LOC117291377 [Asterias rubens]|uniref:uncharacterized protein LOC117291377 n=1 Tax=Asterias rubens TaxID=7604 RepID=UPI001455B154|nr:uncharacterized protein LOC117291377 [Asterias rubens]